MLWHLTLAGLLPGLAAAHQNSLTWTKDAVRMNHVQTVGTHNSYHIEMAHGEVIALDEKLQWHQWEDLPPDWNTFRYSYPPLDHQLEHFGVRSLKLDVVVDEKATYQSPVVNELAKTHPSEDPAWKLPGTKVMNFPELDMGTTCVTLVQCLTVIRDWVEAHPLAVPIPILLQFKCSHDALDVYYKLKPSLWSDGKRLDGVDKEIREVFRPELLITPDDVRMENKTLEYSILKQGWPDLESARGRVFFLMHNDRGWKGARKYRGKNSDLKGRVLFTNSKPGKPDCAFQRIDKPTTDEELLHIHQQVKLGYFVRTRADEPFVETNDEGCNTTRRDRAFESGAQIVTTNFPVPKINHMLWCDYSVQLPEGKTAICNPVDSPRSCDDSAGRGLEPEVLHASNDTAGEGAGEAVVEKGSSETTGGEENT